MLDRFCLDVFALLLDEVSGDPETLSAISLVRRCFTAPCQALLFRTIRLLLSRTVSKQCEALYHAILRNPSIARSVQHLHLRDTSYAGGYGIRNWMVADRNLHLLLPLLQPSLRSLHVEGICQLQCQYFSPLLTEAFYDLYNSPNLTHVKLSGLNQFPISPLRDCRSLKHLSIWSVMSRPPLEVYPEVVPALRSALSLASLTVHCHGQSTGMFLEMLTSPGFVLDVSRLRKLCIAPTSTADLALLGPLVEKASKSLEHLVICPTLTYVITSEPTLLDIPFTATVVPIFPDLRSLTIDLASYAVDLSSSLTASSQLIRKINTSGRLRSFKIILPRPPTSEVPLLWSDSGWCDLDAALAGCTALRDVRVVAPGVPVRFPEGVGNMLSAAEGCGVSIGFRVDPFWEEGIIKLMEV